MQAGSSQRAQGAHVDGAADAAFERRGLRRLPYVSAGDEVRGQNVEGEFAPVIVGGEDAVIERHDVVLRAKPAHADIQALTPGGARDGDPGDVAQRVCDVVVGKAPELDRVDRVHDDLGVLLLFQRLSKARPDSRDHDGFELRLVASVGSALARGRVRIHSPRGYIHSEAHAQKQHRYRCTSSSQIHFTSPPAPPPEPALLCNT